MSESYTMSDKINPSRIIICVARSDCGRSSGRLFPRSCLKVSEKTKLCNFRLKNTLVADEPSARQLMLRAVSPWERCRRGKSSTGGKCLSDLGLRDPRTTRFKWNVTIFRTYDNLASYEPGNMEYRGRAYSTEVGAILVYFFIRYPL